MITLIRWVIFLTIALPVHLLSYLIYPLFHLAWRLLVFKKQEIKLPPDHDFDTPSNPITHTRIDGLLLDNQDEHGALTMYGFITPEGLKILHNYNGDLARRYPNNYDFVSGDVVISYVFAYMFTRYQDKASILTVANNYMRHLGTRSYDKGDPYVSGRCSNFGLNYIAEYPYISQPLTGPQYYTTAAVLALASQHSSFYKALFWVHWVVMGGWFWAFSPVLYSKTDGLHYVRDMVMKSLYVQKQVFGNKWWIIKPMLFITDTIATHKNDLFYAMLGRNIGPLPTTMDGFFSQRSNSRSAKTDTMSHHIPIILKTIVDKNRIV